MASDRDLDDLGTAAEIDLYTEPDADVDTLRNLGPLAPMAGVFEGLTGADVHPAKGGDEGDAYVEHYELQPIDRQTNGPQLLYGLRYHQHIRKPGEAETFHDQVGYWLWEPATEAVTLTLTIPRAQSVLAAGRAAPDATTFTVAAERGSSTNGIVSGPFLDANFRTISFSMTVTILGPDAWAYDEVTVLQISWEDRLGAAHRPRDAAPNRPAYEEPSGKSMTSGPFADRSPRATMSTWTRK